MAEDSKTPKVCNEFSFQEKVKEYYKPEDLARVGLLRGVRRSWRISFYPGNPEIDVSQSFLDHATVCGFRQRKIRTAVFIICLSRARWIERAFDLPTQMGYDSDHELSRGEVGRVGVAIDSIEDMERLLEGIPLDKVSTSMTINSTAYILLGIYVCVAKRRGIPLTEISGTVQNDILKEYIARGTYIYPPEFSMKLVPELWLFVRRMFRNGIRSAYPAITFVKRGAHLFKKSRSR